MQVILYAKSRNKQDTMRERSSRIGKQTAFPQPPINTRLTRRVMFGAIAGGENPGISGPNQCLADDFIKVFFSHEGGIHGKLPFVDRSTRDGVV